MKWRWGSMMKSMKYKNNPALVEVSRELRKNMTSEESRLWYHFLRNYPVKIVRQKIIDYYIADFYCSSAQLAIEIDGIQHYTPEGMEHDKVRTEMIELRGIKVIRIKNTDVLNNFDNVCEYIDTQIQNRISLLSAPC